MKCDRIGGCLREKTKNWAFPQSCPTCDFREAEEADQKLKLARARKKHLGDVAFVNQNARGK